MSQTKTLAEPQQKAGPAPTAQKQPELLEKQAGPSKARAVQRAALGALPPPGGMPPPARAANMLATPEVGTGAASRARMSGAIQRSVGNARINRMLGPAPAASAPTAIAHSRAVPASPGKKPAATTPLIQRKCACGDEAGPDGECAECRAKRQALQRQATEPSEPTSVPDSVHRVLNASGGQPLPEATRAPLEHTMGADFSGVRVHTDSQAARAARDINAEAFTHGQSIYFGEGRYQPETPSGQKRLAHELTHTVQQASGRSELHTSAPISQPGEPLEREAETVASRITETGVGNQAGWPGATPLQRTQHQAPVGQRVVQRSPDAGDFDAEQRKLIQEAKTPGDVKSINPFAFRLASKEERFRLIGILLNQTWVGPRDEYALEHIWASFGKDLPSVATERLPTWQECIKRGADLWGISELIPLKQRFRADVVARARSYLDKNKSLAENEKKRFGLDDPNAPMAPDQAKQLAQLSETAKQVRKANDYMLQLKTFVFVGYNQTGFAPIMPSKLYPLTNKVKGLTPVRFDPEHRPQVPPQRDELAPMPTWEATKEKYDKLQEFVSGATDKNPVLYALLRENKLEDVSQENRPGNAALDAARARKSMAESLSTLLSNIDKTYSKLNDPEDPLPLELTPIHQQMFTSDPFWKLAFPQEVANTAVGDYKNKAFWEALGIGTLQLALFVVAELTSGGLATFFFVAGAVGSAATAVSSWEKFMEARAASRSNLSDETAILSEGQATGKLVTAILDTVFAFLDVYAASKGAAKLLKEGEAAEGIGKLKGNLAEAEGREVKETKEALLQATNRPTSALSPAQIEREFEVAQREGQRSVLKDKVYAEEIALSNGHTWRRRRDGRWCRFSEETCFTFVFGEGREHGAGIEIVPSQRRPTRGMWDGTPGNSNFTPNDPAILALTNYEPIPYRNGYPDFSRWAEETVILPQSTMAGRGRAAHFDAADQILAQRRGWLRPDLSADVARAALYRQNQRLTWHHAEEGITLQLVPRDLHEYAQHAGGISVLSAGTP